LGYDLMIEATSVYSEQQYHLAQIPNNLMMCFFINSSLIKLSHNPKEPGLVKKIEEALEAILASNLRTYLFIAFDLKDVAGRKHTRTLEHLDKGQKVVSYMLCRTN